MTCLVLEAAAVCQGGQLTFELPREDGLLPLFQRVVVGLQAGDPVDLRPTQSDANETLSDDPLMEACSRCVHVTQSKGSGRFRRLPGEVKSTADPRVKGHLPGVYSGARAP